MVATIPDCMAASRRAAEARRSGQESLFGGGGGGEPIEVPEVPLRSASPWTTGETLKFEKEALGFHVTGHPLDEWSAWIDEFCSVRSGGVADLADGTPVVLGGVVAQCRVMLTRRQERMARVRMEDQSGVIDVIAFPETFSRHAELLGGDRAVVVLGHVDLSRGELQVIADRVIPIEESAMHLSTRLELLVAEEPDGPGLEATVKLLHGILRQASSSVAALQGRPVEVSVTIAVGEDSVRLAPRGIRVVPESGLLTRLGELLGAGRVRVRGGFPPERARPRRNGPPRRSEEPAFA
jgi:DNA polymerase-3 subunit alpha